MSYYKLVITSFNVKGVTNLTFGRMFLLVQNNSTAGRSYRATSGWQISGRIQKNLISFMKNYLDGKEVVDLRDIRTVFFMECHFHVRYFTV
jgi:hypothetical protein